MTHFTVDLRGKAALVTGAGAGPGRAIARALASSGAAVAICDINIERAEAVVAGIEAGGGNADPFHADVSNRFQAANLIERTRDAFGGIDILVNAAEILDPEPLLTIDEWNWRRQLEVNISGAFFCLQLAARVMADEGGGIIINLASDETRTATQPAGMGFVVGKAGLAAMTRQAARELSAHGIQVYGIAARQRDGAEDKIGDLALFLCSAAARGMNGRVLAVED